MNLNGQEFIKNAHGGYDLKNTVKEIDLARDSLVKEIVAKAKSMSEQIAQMKKGFFDDINAFVELSAEKYGVKYGGIKGNIQLVSYDGEYKIIVAVNETIQFDERLQVAKNLIDQCISRWSRDSRTEIRALIKDAFYVGKSGKINTARILGLRRLDIQDGEWKKAMDAISDSVSAGVSRSYIRVYRKNAAGEYGLINLDIAKF